MKMIEQRVINEDLACELEFFLDDIISLGYVVPRDVKETAQRLNEELKSQ